MASQKVSKVEQEQAEQAQVIADRRTANENSATKNGIIIMAIGEHKYITKPDAKMLTGWSLAYINKLVNSVDDKPAQVNGIQMAGLGWLVDFHSLVDFKATSRRKQGLQSKRWQALESFLSDTNRLKSLLASDNDNAVVNAWSTLDDKITQAHKNS